MFIQKMHTRTEGLTLNSFTLKSNFLKRPEGEPCATHCWHVTGSARLDITAAVAGG